MALHILGKHCTVEPDLQTLRCCLHFYYYYLVVYPKTGSPQEACAGLQLVSHLLPLPPRCWNYSRVPPPSVVSVCGVCSF